MADPANLPVFHVVGFTGHRKLRDPAATERVLREVLDGLRSEAGVEWLALSSIAEGADMLFARTALQIGLGWEAVLPMPPAEFRADFSPEGWRAVEALLAEAEHVRAIGERTAREDAYLDCGMETVNHCDVLLAVWNGEPSRGRGGTAEIVGYAREIGRPVIVIDARDLSVRRENFERLQVGDRHLAFFNRLPAPPQAVPHDSADCGRSVVQDFQARVDHAANVHAPHDKRHLATILWLHVLATVLAAAGLAFDRQLATLPWARLACLLVALGIALLVRHRREQHDWVRCRLAAEITRSALATWGLPRSLRLFDDFEWAGLEPLRRSLDILHRRGARLCPASFDEFKQRYIHERIDGQLAYLTRQQARAEPQRARLRFGFFLCSLLAMCFAAAAASHTLAPDLQAPAWVQTWVYAFGPVVLPMLAAAFIALIHVNDLHRRVARYHELQVRLQAARREAVFVQTWGALERVVVRAERALLQEVFEWHSITSFTEAK
jgi:hypothetical protein